MNYMRINEAVTIPVADYKSLLVAWRMHGGPQAPVALRFIVAKPLTDSEFRRLPSALKGLIDSPDDSVAFLEWLYNLEDLRSQAESSPKPLMRVFIVCGRKTPTHQ